METTTGKRKFHENPLTAKAESGTLRVKIMRRERQLLARQRQQQQQQQQVQPPPLQSISDTTMPSYTAASDDTQQTIATEQEHFSPPKPRPNRKHVPIFYQRKTTLMDLSGTRSTDDISMQSSSAAMSVSSASSSNMSQDDIGIHARSISQFHQTPSANPLFSRQNSGGASQLLSEIQQQWQAQAQQHANANQLFQNLSAHEQGPVAALHQLANSSATFDARPSQSPVRIPATAPSNYQFNAFTVLQSVIDSQLAAANNQNHSASTDVEDTRMDDDDDDVSTNDLGPPPSAPPAFTVQHSLMGGGIEMAPVMVANVNTRNFDWSRRNPSDAPGRPRSGSLPSIPTSFLPFQDPNQRHDASQVGASQMWHEI